MLIEKLTNDESDSKEIKEAVIIKMHEIDELLSLSTASDVTELEEMEAD